MGTLSLLRLHNFRNYTAAEVNLEPGLNLVIGQNGQGKTNLLEAVSYLALLRSFRTGRIQPLTRWGMTGFDLAAEYMDFYGDRHKMDVVYHEKRELFIDGKAVEKASDFINQFICIPFVPEDIDLVKGPAGLRRRFVNILLSQTKPGYMQDLQRYNEVLKNRNYMLKQPHKYSSATVRAYDQVMVKVGASIIFARRQLIEALNVLTHDLSESVFASRHISVRYDSSIFGMHPEEEDIARIEENFYEVLAHNFEKDLERGQTRKGPHRDDVQLLLDTKLLSEYGSEGEMRICSLILRLASLQFAKSNEQMKGIILLVDDVTGELDAARRKSFYQLLQLGDQILLAATEVPLELKDISSKVMHVEEGELV